MVDLENFNEIVQKLNIYEKLGVNNLILEPNNNLKIISLDLKEKIKNQTNINVYYRINLQTNNINEFKNKIKKISKFPHVVSVESSNKDVQIHAARDSRVDIISFSNQQNLKTLTPGVISLIKQNLSFIEFSLASLMIKNLTTQSKNFRMLYRFIKLALDLKTNCIISGNFKNLYDFRHPRALVSICNSLLEIPLNEAKKIFKYNPEILLKRVKKRLNSDEYENGVQLIKS